MAQDSNDHNHLHSTDTNDSKHKDLMTSVARAASYNIVLQLMFRVLTFVINAILLRYITKDLLGIVNVRLTLLYSTILFVGREPFRKACLTKTPERISYQEVVNIAWCSPIVGAAVSCVLSYIWLYHLESPPPEYVDSYKVGVVCFSLSAILEMCSEPVYVIGQKLLYVRFRAILEGVALIIKCLMSISLVVVYPQLGILAFCCAQISFALVYTGGCYIYFGYLATAKVENFPFTSPFMFIPQRPSSGLIKIITLAVPVLTFPAVYFKVTLLPKFLVILCGQVFINRHLAGLTWSFLKQSFLKQLLTEGEKYVMTIFNILSFADQGVFDIISNLGSLVARFLFAPIEESSYLLFSQSITRGTPGSTQPKDSLHVMTEALSHMTKLLTLIGLTILVFGYSYSPLLLHIYGGQLLSTGIGPYLLRWYCVYVLLMAVNGITEAFSFATMSQVALDRYNYVMLVFTGIFLGASLLFTTYFGSAGFIMANCCNLVCRTVHSVHVIGMFYKDTGETPIRSSLVGVKVILVYAVILAVTSTSQAWFDITETVSALLHIAVGVACLLSVLLCIYFWEPQSISFLIHKFIRPMFAKKAKTT